MRMILGSLDGKGGTSWFLACMHAHLSFETCHVPCRNVLALHTILSLAIAIIPHNGVFLTVAIYCHASLFMRVPTKGGFKNEDVTGYSSMFTNGTLNGRLRAVVDPVDGCKELPSGLMSQHG